MPPDPAPPSEAPAPRAIQIETHEALVAAVEQLAGCARLALDTEGNGMHAYRTELCVIQLCEARADAPATEVLIIDPLAIGDLTPLARVLSSQACEIVIHDLAFDARLLASRGVRVARVVDTALYARYLGLAETGLGALLASRHGIALSKAMQHDDWARRPLSQPQLEYLGRDVAHLGPLAAGLERDAATAGIIAEIEVETAYALANAEDDAPQGSAYARIKGARDLAPQGRAALRELVAVREAAAMRWNIPVGRVIANAALIQLARNRPRTALDVRRIAGLSDRGATIVPDVLAAIARGEAVGDVPEAERAEFERVPLAAGEMTVRRAREVALHAWRTTESKARAVDPQVVLPGHVVHDIVREAPSTLDALAAIPGIGGVRVARYGEALLALLAEAEKKRPP